MRAIRQAQAAGNRLEALATGPAHRRRMGVHPLAPAKFPDAGVGEHRAPGGLLAERLKQPEQQFIAGLRQPPVEKHQRRGEDDAAIDVVLILRPSRVTDPHRTIAAVTRQRRRLVFFQRIGMHDAVQRAQRLGAADRDAEDVRDEVFHRLGGADAIESADDENTRPVASRNGSPSCGHCRGLRGSRW